MHYITHARTPEELKAEICSYLRQRISATDGYARVVAKSATDKAKLAAVSQELADMLRYWSEVQIIRPKRNRQPSATDNPTEA